MYFFDQSEKTLFSKNEPYFWRLIIKLSYKIQTNPFRMFMYDQKTIDWLSMKCHDRGHAN